MNRTVRQRLNSEQTSYNRAHEASELTNQNETLFQSDFVPKPESSDLLIIGAGLMRTGTTSLKHALELLYQKPCYHMSNVVFQFKQEHIKLWIKLFEQRNHSHTLTQSDLIQNFQRIYDGFQMAIDYPTCAFYQELLQLYPEAKVILTVRDADEWVDSVQATMGSKSMRRQPTPGEYLVYAYHGVKHLWKLHYLMFTATLGPNFFTMTRNELKESYCRWNEQVISNVPAHRLLIFNSSDGWSPLCRFLQLPIPDPKLAYPHLNTRKDMVRALNRYLIPGRILDCLILCVIVLSVLMIFY